MQIIFKDQYVALVTIIRREVFRFLRIWTQTLFPPVITQSLYFVVFGEFIGSQVRHINGVSYMAFIVPGLVMMAVINSTFSNVVSSFFSAKFQRSIEELLVSPATHMTIIIGYVVGGMIRGILVGSIVFLVSGFFTRPVVHNFLVIIIFVILTALIFSLAGLLNAILAKKFDDVSIFPTFVLMPLTYLGGVFYSIHSLPGFWQRVSLFNPILYMVNGFRFGFYGFSDVNVVGSVFFLIALSGVLFYANLYLMKNGTGIRS